MELKIGELARRTGVNIQTIRYYERQGLLLPVRRKDSGYRMYDEEGKKRLEFIIYAKKWGSHLKRQRNSLSLR